MEKKITMMKLKVDLQCQKCYKKVKKVLCKFPQIRDQIYDEKKNMVTIKVVCCDPERIRDKLCCKGGGSIKSIEILEPPTKPKKPEKPKEKAKDKDPKQTTRPPPPGGEPPLDDETPPPGQPQPASKFPKPPPPITVLAYPPPAPTTPVGWFHDGYYERPIYDSYGGGGSRYYVSHYEYDQNLNAENESGCTII